MRGGWWTKNRCPIGLDLGARTIKIMQLQRRGQALQAVAAASGLIPDDLPQAGRPRADALALVIHQLLDSAPFVGRRVVSCLPASAVTCKNLRVPQMPPDEMRAAIEWEAADRLGVAPDTTSFQFLDAGEVRQGDDLKREIILLAVSHALVQEHVQLLQACGLKPLAIDATPGALARWSAWQPPVDHDSQAHVVLDVGYACSKVVIARHGQILFFKLIDIGGQRFDQTVAQHLSLPLPEAAEMRRRLAGAGAEEEHPEQLLFGMGKRQNIHRAVYEAFRPVAGELARELALCLRYYSVTFRGRRPDAITLVGGESTDPNLARALAEGAGVRVQPADFARHIDLSAIDPLQQVAPAASAAWAVAAGLSMRAEPAALGAIIARGAA